MKNIVKLLCEKEKLPFIEGLWHKDTLYQMNSEYEFILSEKKEMTYKELMSLERLDVNIACRAENEKYNIYGGETSYGGEGFILITDKSDNIIFLLLDMINPIVDLKIHDDVITAKNNNHEAFEIPINKPWKMKQI